MYSAITVEGNLLLRQLRDIFLNALILLISLMGLVGKKLCISRLVLLNQTKSLKFSQKFNLKFNLMFSAAEEMVAMVKVVKGVKVVKEAKAVKVVKEVKVEVVKEAKEVKEEVVKEDKVVLVNKILMFMVLNLAAIQAQEP